MGMCYSKQTASCLQQAYVCENMQTPALNERLPVFVSRKFKRNNLIQIFHGIV